MMIRIGFLCLVCMLSGAWLPAAATTFDNGIPAGWVCAGNCGVLAEDGDISLAPEGGSNYGWISTVAGRHGLYLPGFPAWRGSTLRSEVFSARAGQELQFYFNYITSDGAGFSDYAWARLLDASGQPVVLLFTARTNRAGSTVPGFGMPPVAATVIPEFVQVAPRATNWSPLGFHSGRCYNIGCGNTGWVKSLFTIPEPGDYILEFGVVNVGDNNYDSGMAFDGLLLDGRPLGSDADYADVRLVAKVPHADIQLLQDSFVLEPQRVEDLGDHFEIEWHFPEFSIGQLATLDFRVALHNAPPGSSREVVREVSLSYRDSLGVEHRRLLGPANVNVLDSVFDVTLATDRPRYAAGDHLKASVGIENLSQFAQSFSVTLAVLDDAGNLVADIGHLPSLSLGVGETTALTPVLWPVADTYVGNYQVRVTLFDSTGDIAHEQTVGFEVVPQDDAQVSATVATDKISYQPNDELVVSGFVNNAASNALVSDARVVLRVVAPDGSDYWHEILPLAQLGAGSFADLERRIALDGAEPGAYHVHMQVLDKTAAAIAVSQAQFDVLSTLDTGAGVTGSLSLSEASVFRTEYVDIQATVANDGNADLAGLPVKLSIVDPANRQVVAEWTHTLVQLSVEDIATLQEEWFADAPIGATYAAVLAIEVGGHERILATRTFAMADKLPASLTLSGRGRLLALVDAEAPGACKGVTELSVGFRPDLVLLPQDQVAVSLHDAGGELVDAETVLTGELADGINNSPGTPVDLAVTAATADRLALTLSAAENVSFVNGSYRLTGTHWQAGHAHVYDSDVFEVDCTLEAGAAYGNFGIEEVLGADGADVHGPEDAPTRLAQRHMLQRLLDNAGWPYTLVHNAEDFARELRTGGYTVYALFNEQVKLPEALQQELVQAVAEGAGLVYAGYHDRRNGRLEPALGILSQGVLPRVHGLSLADAALHEDQQDFDFALDGRPLRATANGADELASYVPAGGLAIAEYRYGEGHSLCMGFDVLAEATAAGEESVPARLLSAALGRVHPASLTPVAGKVVPMSLRITNRGMPVGGQVLLALPAGAQVVDGGSARLKVDGSLLWPFTLAQGETLTAPFWVRLPSLGGAAIFNGSIIVGVEQGGSIEYGPVSATLDVLVE